MQVPRISRLLKSSTWVKVGYLLKTTCGDPLYINGDFFASWRPRCEQLIPPLWLASGHWSFYQREQEGSDLRQGRGLASVPVGGTLWPTEFKKNPRLAGDHHPIQVEPSQHEFDWERQGCRQGPVGQNLQVSGCHRGWRSEQVSVTFTHVSFNIRGRFMTCFYCISAAD